MVSVHPIHDARCTVPLPAGAARCAVSVRLYGSDVPCLLEPLGVWSFGPDISGATDVEVDLARLDAYSLRLVTAAGTRLARAFHGSSDDAVSARMRLEVTLPSEGERCVHEAKLALSGDELTALRRRLGQARTPPIEWFFVELTNHCNLACPWCPSAGQMKRPRGSMPLERARDLWGQIAAYQKAHPRFRLYAEIKNQVFLHVMGEPLLHPHFFKILEEGHRLGLDFCLVTNASTLQSSRIEPLLDSGIKAVVVSLNVTDTSEYRAVHSAVSYEQVVAQIQELIAARHRRRSPSPRIEIQLLCTESVVLPGGTSLGRSAAVEAEIAAWARFVAGEEARAGIVSARPPALDLPHSLLPGDGELDVRHPIGENISVTVKRACNFANALLPEGAVVRTRLYGHCPGQNPSRVLCVLWDGSCTFCSLDYDGEVGLGNVFELGIEAIWTDGRLCRIRQLMERGIAVESICQRCFGTIQEAPERRSPAEERMT